MFGVFIMSPYKWCCILVTFAVFTCGVGFSFDSDGIYLHAPFQANFIESIQGPRTVQGRPKGINVTDLVYKSALRFLLCSTVPENQYGIALLDPLAFTWDRLSQKQTIRLYGTINGTESYISQLNINRVKVTLVSLSATFKGVLPRLSIAGTYNITGSLAEALPVFGSGPYSIDAYNVTLSVATALGMNPNGSFFMSNFTVKYSPKSVQITLGDVLGGGQLGAMVQSFLQDAILQVVKRSRPLIQQDLRETVVAAANSRLVNITRLDDLITFFVTFGNVTNVC